jgi:hypothetical protein
MLSFLKKRAKADDLGVVLFESVKKATLAGLPDFFPNDSPIGLLGMKNEWVYLNAFSIDYQVFVALGNSAERDAILRPFWRNIKDWLWEEKVGPLPERFWLIGDGGLKKIPPEDCETSWERLERRI